ncbi:hypothetical protein Trydic_g10792 [Trypoxylus dichotomus]
MEKDTELKARKLEYLDHIMRNERRSSLQQSILQEKIPGKHAEYNSEQGSISNRPTEILEAPHRDGCRERAWSTDDPPCENLLHGHNAHEGRAVADMLVNAGGKCSPVAKANSAKKLHCWIGDVFPR